MIIEQLDIRRFGKLVNFKTDLDPSFNLIEGRNESGKSTLAAFIFYMLYGFADGDVSPCAERVLRAPWDGEQIDGAMTVRANGKRYRIERTSFLDKDGYRDTFVMTDLEDGNRETGGTAPGERFLGIPADVFANTAFIDAPSFGRVDGDAMTNAIENIIFSADEKLSVVRALLALKQASHQIVSADGKGGVMLSFEKQRDALEERLIEARAREKELIEQENLLHATKQKRMECAKELAKFHRLETDYRNAVIIRDYDRLHELEDSADERERAIIAYEKENKKGGFLPDATYLTDLAMAKSEMDTASSRAADAQEALAAEEAKPFPASEEEKILMERLRAEGTEEDLFMRCSMGERKKKKQLLYTCLFVMMALTFGILSAVSAFTVGVGIAVAVAAVAFASLPCGLIFFLKHAATVRDLKLLYSMGNAVKREEFETSLRLAAYVEKNIKAYEEALIAARTRQSETQQAKAAARIKLQNILSKWEDVVCTDENYADTVKTVSHAVGEYLHHASVLYLARERADAEVRTLRAQLKGYDEIAVRALVPPAEREALCNHNADDLRHGVAHYEKMLASFTEKEEKLTEQLAALPRKEGSAEVAEEMMLLDRRMVALSEKASVCNSAQDKLRGTLERLRTEISPRLSVYACALLDELTDGKYTELHITDELTLSVTAEGEARHVAYLSHGTKELTYLALRMALLDLLYKEQPPLCLDDTAAHQDDERAASFMQSLRTLAGEGKQCFLFSCRERDRRLADRVFASYRRISMQ